MIQKAVIGSMGNPAERQPFRILGAGPSGLTAAITLARAGRAVEIFEAREDCGARFHDDFQGIENWTRPEPFVDQMAAWGLETSVLDARPIHRVELLVGGGSARVVHSPRAAAHLVRRGMAAGTLDQALKRQALDLGVKIHFRTRAPGTCDIEATGPRGPTGYVTGILFDTSDEDRITLLFDDSVAPGGYGYRIVSRGRGLVAAVVLRSGLDPKACVDGAVTAFDRHYPDPSRRGVSRFGGIGRFGLRTRYTVGGVATVGEAGGIQDALWGFGIRLAVSSGYWAARSLLDGSDYEAHLEREILPTVRSTLLCRRLVDTGGERLVRLLVRAWLFDQSARGDGLPFLGRLYRIGSPIATLRRFAERGLTVDPRAVREAGARVLRMAPRGS